MPLPDATEKEKQATKTVAQLRYSPAESNLRARFSTFSQTSRYYTHFFTCSYFCQAPTIWCHLFFGSVPI